MLNKKVLFHYNVPYDIHLKALDFKDYNEGILFNSTFASGLKKGFEANGYKLELMTQLSFFFIRSKTKNRYIYKHFFYLYLILFGFIDNYLLQLKILNLFRNKSFEIYFTELNPVTTSSFLKSLRSKNIKSIQWFGVFPKNLKFNKRPIKLLDQFKDDSYSFAHTNLSWQKNSNYLLSLVHEVGNLEFKEKDVIYDVIKKHEASRGLYFYIANTKIYRNLKRFFINTIKRLSL